MDLYLGGPGPWARGIGTQLGLGASGTHKHLNVPPVAAEGDRARARCPLVVVQQHRAAGLVVVQEHRAPDLL